MFTVFHLNFGTAYQFDSYAEAKAWTIKQCFEAVIYLNGMIVGSFHPISGFHTAQGHAIEETF